MAGQPKTRALIAELERRAAEESCSVSEYAEQWIESGGTLLGLASDLADALNLPVMRATLTRYLQGLEGAGEFEQRITRARSLSAFAHAERSLDIADNDTGDPQATRIRVQARQWIAERFNPSALGAKSAVSVNVTVGSLHLDALRAAPARATATVTGAPQPLLPASSEASTADAQVIEE